MSVRRFAGGGILAVLVAGMSIGAVARPAAADVAPPPPDIPLTQSVRSGPAVAARGRGVLARPYLPPAAYMLVILATIRSLESGGNYLAQNPNSSASGAYQFTDTTWAGYGGFVHARDASPAVQDAKATDSVTKILNANASDISAVPVVWFIGHVPAPTSPEWDTVPGTNRLSPRQYQTLWMQKYHALGGP